MLVPAGYLRIVMPYLATISLHFMSEHMILRQAYEQQEQVYLPKTRDFCVFLMSFKREF